MFVELHAQSAFSFLEGTEQPETLVAEAARLGMPTLALIDRDGLYGAPRFYPAGGRAGLTPLVGSELTLSGGSRLPLLVEDREGYQNLCRLITRMKLGAPKGEAALALGDLEPYAQGLVCLTGGCRGPLGRRLAAGDWEAAPACLDRLVGVLGRSSCFVGVQRDLDREEERTVEGVVGLARPVAAPTLRGAGGGRREAAVRHGAAGRAGAAAGRPRAQHHRPVGSRRLLPDRVGYRRVLPREQHPRAGPGLGRQQRRLLCARHHGGRSHQDGPALRAFPQRGTWRVARHRSGPAERRTAGGGHPLRLPALPEPRGPPERPPD